MGAGRVPPLLRIEFFVGDSNKIQQDSTRFKICPELGATDAVANEP